MDYSSRVIVIAAISARPYVQAAVRAGYRVWVIDGFADADTCRLAEKFARIKAKDGLLDATALLDTLTRWTQSPVAGFCYGAGFEGQPALLAKVATRLPIIGNAATVVRDCKSPQYFFALCKTLSIPHPETQISTPEHQQGWLIKRVGGSGGDHIQRVDKNDTAPDTRQYYQRELVGLPVSCLFIADNVRTQIVGLNMQWCSPTEQNPFRFGGAVSCAALSENVVRQFEHHAHMLSRQMALRGLNSLDAIVQDDVVYVLEINPRLSATLDLYHAKNVHLFQAHLSACQGEAVADIDIDPIARAMHIVYTDESTIIPSHATWPAWVRDIPMPDSVISAGAPICTVVAEADTAKAARGIVALRAASL